MYSHITVGHGLAPGNMSDLDFKNKIIGGTAQFWSNGSIALETNFGLIYLNNIKASSSKARNIPASTVDKLNVLDYIENLKGGGVVYHYYSILTNQSVPQIVFQDTTMELSSYWGTGGTLTTLKDVMTHSISDLLSPTAKLDIGGSEGSDVLVLKGGGGQVNGYGGNDTFIGDKNSDRFFGGDGNDTYVGNGGNDEFYFSSTIDGSPGNDNALGGANDDQFFLGTVTGSQFEKIDGGPGNDTVSLQGDFVNSANSLTGIEKVVLEGDLKMLPGVFDNVAHIYTNTPRYKITLSAGGTSTLNFGTGMPIVLIGSSDHDEVKLAGSVDDYTIVNKDPANATLSTQVTWQGSTIDLSKIEQLTFEKPTDAPVTLTNASFVSEAVHQTNDVYKDSIGGTWHRPEAIELDLDPGTDDYKMSKGVYIYQTQNSGADGIFANFDGVAAVGVGIVNGERVMSVAIKGTNDPGGELLLVDLTYQLQSYYDVFRPFFDSLKAFVSNKANGIQKVMANGHSLGGAMAEYLVAELGKVAFGYTFGSIGTTSNINARLTNFVHVGDIADDLMKNYGGSRAGGTVWLNASDSSWNGHSAVKYQQNVDLLMKYAADQSSAFSKTALAKSLLGNGFTNGSIEVAIGTSGDNTIKLRTNDVYAIGDAGNDRFIAIDGLSFTDSVAGAGGRVINGGTGDDTLVLSGHPSDYIRTPKQNGSLQITRVSDGMVVATLENSVEYIQYSDSLYKFDGTLVPAKTYSGAANTSLGGDGTYAKVGNGSGKISGTDGDDTIIAGLGSKSIFGGNGSDELRIDSGTSAAAKALNAKIDTVLIDGGSGADTMIGGQGNETYIVDNIGDVTMDAGGNDVVKSGVDYSIGDGIENLILTGKAVRGAGNAGSNIIIGTTAANTINGLAGNDTLVGGSGSDALFGGDGLDTASYASAKAGVNVYMTQMQSNTTDAAGDSFSSIENVTGSNYTDKLSGDANANGLNGGDGNDFLYGGAGADTLVGGLGADIFTYKAISESSVAAFDRIKDFNRGQKDRFDLSGIDASTKVAGNNAFVFIGNAAFTGAADQLRFQSSASGTEIYGDTNGDKVADFRIHLSTAQVLNATDFTL